MQVVILAGGLGTRIRAISGTLPKALIPIVGIPFIFYQIEWLQRNSVTDILVSIGYGASQIHQALTERFPDHHIVCCDEGEALRGTAGALRFAGDQGLLQDSFVLLYGDSYLPISIDPLWRASESGRLPTMSVLRNNGRWDRSNVIFQNGLIELYDKRVADPVAAGMMHIDYGLSVLRRNLIDRFVPSGSVMDLADILTPLSRAGQLRGHEVYERFYEIGSVHGVRDFEAYVATHAAIRPATR